MGAERWLPSQSSWGARREVRSRCSVIYSINIYRAASRGQAFARGAPGAAPNEGLKPCLCEAGVPSGRERPALHRLGPEKKRGGGRVPEERVRMSHNGRRPRADRQPRSPSQDRACDQTPRQRRGHSQEGSAAESRLVDRAARPEGREQVGGRR